MALLRTELDGFLVQSLGLIEQHMAHVEAKAINEAVRDVATLTPEAARDVLVRIAANRALVHSMRVSHRTVAPSNDRATIPPATL